MKVTIILVVIIAIITVLIIRNILKIRAKTRKWMSSEHETGSGKTSAEKKSRKKGEIYSSMPEIGEDDEEEKKEEVVVTLFIVKDAQSKWICKTCDTENYNRVNNCVVCKRLRTN